jgi:hypothetical protein
MQIEDLIFEDDARGCFENISDLDAVIVAGIDDGEIHGGWAVNPDIDPRREFGALGWCAQLVTRIEHLGFDEAMKTDAGSIAATGDGNYGPCCRPATSRLTLTTTPQLITTTKRLGHQPMSATIVQPLE